MKHDTQEWVPWLRDLLLSNPRLACRQQPRLFVELARQMLMDPDQRRWYEEEVLPFLDTSTGGDQEIVVRVERSGLMSLGPEELAGVVTHPETFASAVAALKRLAEQADAPPATADAPPATADAPPAMAEAKDQGWSLFPRFLSLTPSHALAAGVLGEAGRRYGFEPIDLGDLSLDLGLDFTDAEAAGGTLVTFLILKNGTPVEKPEVVHSVKVGDEVLKVDWSGVFGELAVPVGATLTVELAVRDQGLCRLDILVQPPRENP